MENNGRASISKITKHIESCYFFITDNIGHWDLKVKYWSTEKIWDSVLDKPN